MPTYSYKVRDKFGKLISGSMGSDNSEALALHFEAMGYTPISITEEGPGSQGASASGRFKKVKQEDLNMFSRQLVTLIKAGLPLLGSLNALVEQTKNPVMKEVALGLIKSIESGSSFSEALRRYPSIFSSLYVNTVRAGEAGGALDEVLARLADLGEHEARSMAKIQSALRYPIAAISVLVIAFFVLVTYVVPQFATIFESFKGELPIPTKILIWLSEAIKKYWYIALMLTALAVFAFKRFAATKSGRRILDRFKLKAPIVGQIVFLTTMSRFSRILAIMLKSGVPLLASLEMVSRATGNAVVEDAVKDITESVNQGKTMSAPMAKSRVFSTVMVQMMAIGEETGKIDELMFRVSDYYDEQSDNLINNLSTMIEPVLILFLGGIVLVLALAIFLPMWNMISLFKGG